MQKRNLAISEKSLGPDHPDVGFSLNNLALVYMRQGRFTEAEPVFRRSLAIFEKALGAEHPNVGKAVGNGCPVPEPGRYSDAEPLQERRLTIDEKVEQASNETQAFFHNRTLLPGHRHLPCCRKRKVSPMCPVRTPAPGIFRQWPAVPLILLQVQLFALPPASAAAAQCDQHGSCHRPGTGPRRNGARPGPRFLRR